MSQDKPKSPGELPPVGGIPTEAASSEINVRDLMRAMPVETAKKLEGRVDKNHDGHITADELGQLFHELEEDEAKIKVLRWELLVAVVFLAISIIANLGTAMYAAEEARTTGTSSNGELTTKDGKTVVATDSSTMSVAEVKHATPSSSTSAATTAPATTTDSVLTDKKTGKPLKTVPEYEARKQTKLTSELGDEFFNELEKLSIKNANGQINFDVHGWARYDSADSRCGNVVVLYTGPGQVQFDGVAMSFTETVAGAFSRAGFHVTARRRGRRAEPDDATAFSLQSAADVMGQFRFLADSNLDLTKLTCGDDRPHMTPPLGLENVNPELVSYSQTMMVRCGAPGKPACPADSSLTQEFDGRTYFTRTMNTIARKISNGTYFQITEMTAPELPGYSVVAVTDGNQTLTYTKKPDGVATQCGVSAGVQVDGMDMGGSNSEYDTVDGEVVDHSGDDANTTYTKSDEPPTVTAEGNKPVLQFVGYDVLNGVYVRHFSVAFSEEDGTQRYTDYYEHFDEKRMFSLTIDPERVIQTYEKMDATSFSVAPTLNSSEYPSLFTDDAATLLAEPASCVNYTDHTSVDLTLYQMQAFDWGDFEAERDRISGEVDSLEAERRARSEDDAEEGDHDLAEAAFAPESDENMPATSETRQLLSRRGSLRSPRAKKRKSKYKKCGKDKEKSMSGSVFDGYCTITGTVGYGQCANYLEFKLACSYIIRRSGPFIQIGGHVSVEGGTYRNSKTQPWHLDLKFQGCAWIKAKDTILGITCEGTLTACISYSLHYDTVTVTGNLDVRCGRGSSFVSANLGATVKFSRAVVGGQFPKIIKSITAKVKGCLNVNERVCHPWVKCGWRGCKTYTQCHHVRFKECIGPLNFKLK
jgi:hypothetical protein